LRVTGKSQVTTLAALDVVDVISSSIGVASGSGPSLPTAQAVIKDTLKISDPVSSVFEFRVFFIFPFDCLP
jgi:hypothetical protein